jgi:hypothetical protein
MLDLERVRSMLSQEHGLAVVSTTQSDGRVLSSVVNCGVIDHPITGDHTWRSCRWVGLPASVTSAAVHR